MLFSKLRYVISIFFLTAVAIGLFSQPTAAQVGASTSDKDAWISFSASSNGPLTVKIQAEIAKYHYVYKNKFDVKVGEEGKGIEIKNVSLPPGKEKDDPQFGQVQIYRKNFAATVSLERANGSSAQEQLPLNIHYQGCKDEGICYPPTTKQVTVSLPPIEGDQVLNEAATEDATDKSAPAQKTDQETSSTRTQQIEELLQGGKFWLILLSFFGFGLLLTFTPCVFPMIPILSSIIVGQGSDVTTGRAFFLSCVYVLAVAVTYSALGVLAGLAGENLQAAFQNPWGIGIFCAIFFALALSMFGFFDIQLPSGLQTRLSQLSNSQGGGTVAGVAIMGFLSALIVGPCVTAPLAGALIYIAETGNAVLGGSALFALSLGMGAPLVVIGTSAGKLLPKAGGWMEVVKAVFGVLLLALAIWMADRVLPAYIIIIAWSILCICCSVYLGAFERARTEQFGRWGYFFKALGLVVFLYGLALLIGAFSGTTSMKHPLTGVVGASDTTSQESAGITFTTVETSSELEQALATAAENDKYAMVDVYADWCASCHELENVTFADAEVQGYLQRMALIKLDVTAYNAAQKELLQGLDIVGPPTLLFYSPEGDRLKDARIAGFISPEKFAQHLERFLED